MLVQWKRVLSASALFSYAQLLAILHSPLTLQAYSTEVTPGVSLFRGHQASPLSPRNRR